MEIRIKNKSILINDEDYCKLIPFNIALVDEKKSTSYVRLMAPIHRFILGINAGDPRIVDHINRNPLDNRKANLRIVNRQQNNHNSSNITKKGKSGYTGIYKRIYPSGKISYIAHAGLNGKTHHIGSFSTIKEAIETRKEFTDKYFDVPPIPVFNKPWKEILIGNKIILIDIDDLSKIQGFYLQILSGHARISISLHKFILGVMSNTDGLKVDHINGNGLDNRKENLRIVSSIENGQNKHLKRVNSTGFYGVRKVTRYHADGTPYYRYLARLRIMGKQINLGSYLNPKDAHLAYLDGIRQYFGDITVEGRRSLKDG
jgi:hypothetical protein